MDRCVRMGTMAVAASAALMLVVSAQAGVVMQASEQGLGAFAAATDDLTNLGTPSLAGQTNSGGSLYSSDPTGIGLNNGTIYDDGSHQATEDGRTYCPANGSSITFDLDLTAQPGGYTIGAIASVSGGTQERRSQRFRIATSVVGNPAFTTLVDENQLHFVSNTGSGEMRVIVADDTGAPLATAVDQVRVTYFDTGATLPQSMYRELDIFPQSPPAKPLPQVTSANLAAQLRRQRPQQRPRPVEPPERHRHRDLVRAGRRPEAQRQLPHRRQADVHRPRQRRHRRPGHRPIHRDRSRLGDPGRPDVQQRDGLQRTDHLRRDDDG